MVDCSFVTALQLSSLSSQSPTLFSLASQKAASVWGEYFDLDMYMLMVFGFRIRTGEGLKPFYKDPIAERSSLVPAEQRLDETQIGEPIQFMSQETYIKWKGHGNSVDAWRQDGLEFNCLNAKQIAQVLIFSVIRRIEEKFEFLVRLGKNPSEAQGQQSISWLREFVPFGQTTAWTLKEGNFDEEQKNGGLNIFSCLTPSCPV